MAGDLDDQRVANSDPAHVIDADRLLVIGQRIRRRATEHPQRAIQRHHHRRHRLVAQRHHHPEPRPRQPRAEQHRPAAVDPRPVAIVPLHPQPWLRDPRPRPPAMLLPPPALGLSHPPPRRPRRSLIAERDQLRHAPCPPGSSRASDRPAHRPSSRTPSPSPAAHARPPASRPPHHAPHPIRDRLVITPHQRCRLAERARQVIRLQDLHHFLRFLHAPSSEPRRDAMTRPRVSGAQDRTGGEIRGRQWGESAAARGEFRWPPMGRIPWPPSAFLFPTATAWERQSCRRCRRDRFGASGFATFS